jgi:hypothetical protein
MCTMVLPPINLNRLCPLPAHVCRPGRPFCTNVNPRSRFSLHSRRRPPTLSSSTGSSNRSPPRLAFSLAAPLCLPPWHQHCMRSSSPVRPSLAPHAFASLAPCARSLRARASFQPRERSRRCAMGRRLSPRRKRKKSRELMQKRWMGRRGRMEKTHKAGGASRAWWRHSRRSRSRCWEATTDLEDLSSGLRLKTAALQAAAAHAAPALPSPLEASAPAASDKLKSIGQAVDDHDIVAGLLANLQDRGLRRSSYNSSICTWPWGGIWVNT